MSWSHRATTSSAPRLVLKLLFLSIVLAAAAANIGGPSARAASTTYASDSFARSVANGWGSADTGGAYSIGGKAQDFSVGSNAGRMAMAAGVSRSAMLPGVWQRDVEISFRFNLDKRPTGANGTIWVYAVARQISDGNEYLAKVRVNSDGSVAVGASRVVNGSETPIGSEVTLASQYSGGADWNFKASFSAASPTQIGVSAWPSTAAAPAAWQYSA